MRIRNTNTLAYEFGVLLFNIISEHKNALQFNNDYDGWGNMVSIWNALVLEEGDKGVIEKGFVAECQNYHIPEEEAVQLFKEVMDKLSEEKQG